MDVKKCNVLAAEIRLETLKVIHSRARSRGRFHGPGDLMAVLYGEVMKFDPKNPRWEDRDWLVLSKGHAGPVAYATFGLMGFYPMEEAYTLNQPHTRFPSHTDRKLTPGVDLTTGSLGQGASTAAGAALGNKIDGRTNHVFCVIGDGEADEGQVWESFQFAYAHKLDNLIYFIDKNGYQLDGPPMTFWLTAIWPRRRSPSACTRRRSTAMTFRRSMTPFRTHTPRRAFPAASCWIPARARALPLPSPSMTTPLSPTRSSGPRPSPLPRRPWKLSRTLKGGCE